MKSASRYLIFAFFVALLAAGLAFGEFRSVLVNAINVCLPCVGIG
jgi:hypothetical protein